MDNLRSRLCNRFTSKEYEECEGGIRVSLQPDPDYPPIDDNEIINSRLEKCTASVDFDDLIMGVYGQSDAYRRRYHRLTNRPYLERYPTTWYPSPVYKSPLANYLWQRYITVNSFPDAESIQQVNKLIKSTLKFCEKALTSTQIETFSFTVLPISLLSTDVKRRLFRAITKMFRCQKNLRNIVLENGNVRTDDGFRLLLIIALTVAPMVEHLHMAHFFRCGVISRQLWENEKDKIMKDDEKTKSQEELNKLWKMTGSYSNLPGPYLSYYKLLLNNTENLEVLHVTYTALAIGSGWVLSNLSSIKLGRLKQLHILATAGDVEHALKIPGNCWLHAIKHCSFTVNLYIMNIPFYDDAVQFLHPGMPVHSFHISSGVMLIDFKEAKERGPTNFDCILQTLIHLYKETIENLSIEVGRVSERLDAILCRCLTSFHRLRSFSFIGRLDKLDTIIEICNFLITYETRLKTVKLRLEQDSCSPQALQEAVEEVKSKYSKEILGRDINFTIETFIF